MLSIFKKKSPDEFIPNKKMMVAAILKGKNMGLPKENLIEMISLMNRNLSKRKVEKIVDRTLN